MKSNYNYIERGKGEVIILLHGLMGAMSNFEHTIKELPKYGYRVILPMLPLYDMPILKTNVQELAKFITEFTEDLKLNNYSILGNYHALLARHVELIGTTTRDPRSDELCLSSVGVGAGRGAPGCSVRTLLYCVTQ